VYAKPRTDKLDVGTFFKKQIAFFSSLLSFLPLFNNGNAFDQHSEEIVQKVKVTGGLKSDRPSGGD